MHAAMFRRLHEVSGETVALYVDGVRVIASAGENVAAVLLRLAPTWTRTTPVSDAQRAPYCMMGVCFDCLATIDGAPSVQTCLTPAKDGMRVDRQRGCASVMP